MSESAAPKYRVKLPEWFFNSWLLPERGKPSEWAENNIVLPKAVSARPGKIQLLPHFKHIIDQLENPEVETITIVSSSQSGKTLALMVMILYVLLKCDDPAILACPTSDLAEDILRRRIRPVINHNPSLKRLVKQDRESKNKFEIHGPSSRAKIGWSSPASLSSFTAKLAVADEIDKFSSYHNSESNATELIRARVTTYIGQGAKVVYSSTPTLESGLIWQSYVSGIQYEWFIMCPSCDQEHTPKFANLKWDKKADLSDLQKDRHSIQYECPHCLSLMKERQYRIAVRQGRWIEKEEQDYPQEGGTEKTYKKSIRHVSYHVHGLLSAYRSFENLVTEFIQAGSNPVRLQHFRNSVLGEPWSSGDLAVKKSDLEGMVDEDYQEYQLRPRTMCLLAGIDVGGNGDFNKDDTDPLHFWVTVIGIQPEGKTYIAACDKITGVANLLEYLGNEYVDPETGEIQRVFQAFIDSGYRTQGVYGLCAQNPGMFPIKGMGGVSYAAKASNIDSVGWGNSRRKLKQSVVRYDVGTDFFKDHCFASINTGNLRFNAGLHDEYFSHLSSEVKVPVRTGGQVKYAYRPRYEGVNNHLLDTTCYAMALAFTLNLWKYNTLEDFYAEFGQIGSKPTDATPPEHDPRIIQGQSVL
jgi:phage terminase large subunit GpA-like protein